MWKKIKWNWFVEGILISLIAAIGFMSCYGLFERRAKSYAENPIETEENIYWLYSNNQLLYRDLYNMLNQTQLIYTDLYYPLTEELQSIDKIKAEVYRQGQEVPSAENPDLYPEETAELYQRYLDAMEGLQGIENYFTELDEDFGELNTVYDYMILDTSTGRYITNSGRTELTADSYCFYLQFVYDENGNVTIAEMIRGENKDIIRKYANALVRPGNGLPSDDEKNLRSYTSSQQRQAVNDYTSRQFPKNCVITYAMYQTQLEGIKSGQINLSRYNGTLYNTYRAFIRAGCGEIYVLCLIILVLCGILLPLPGKEKPWEKFFICRLPLELLVWVPVFVFGMGSSVVSIAIQVTEEVSGNFITASTTKIMSYAANLIYLVFLFVLAWYTGICIRECREWGIWGYFKRRCMIYRFFPFIKRKIKGFYYELTHIDVTQNAKKMIMKIVVVNGVILFIISSMWVAGFTVAIIYSVLLYFVLKKYVSSLQKKYEVLLKATNEIAQGNLNVTIQEDLGVFEPFRPEINRIQKGFKKAVEEEVKSQKMKAELITNVSHDLKTPLTAIITYIGLLKDKNITEEQRKEYLDTLERKSIRLKILIEDLFEISKATSKTVKLEIVDVDIMNLIKQAQLEMSDKMEAAGLEVKMLLPKEKIILPLDSQKTFRIYENLFGNIAKYALHGTRVYVTGTVTEDAVTVTLKNISAQEIQVNPEELTDRFVRGDVSRNTEGSGLGLAIAKSFTELQGGRLSLDVDGDLFKVTTVWPLTR